MKEIDDVTLIVPCNDLESKTIIEVAKKVGFSGDRLIIPRDLGWGARLADVRSEDLARIKTKKVWIVELPGLEKEQELKEKGLAIKIIDHHCYGDLGDLGDRSREESALEQFSALCEHELTEKEMLIAINDRDYIWGLIAAGASFDQVYAIRGDDLKAQGYTEEDLRKAREEYDQKIARSVGKDCGLSLPFFCHTTQNRRFGPLVDRYHMPDSEAWGRYQEDSSSYLFSNILICLEDENKIPQTVFFSGRRQYLTRMKSYFEPLSEKWWAGGNGELSYVSFELQKPGKIKCGNRNRLDQAPVQKFSSIFLFPFKMERDVRIREQLALWEWQSYKIPKGNGELCPSWDCQRNYAEYVYFHDYVRRFLFNTEEAETESQDTVDYYAYKLKRSALIDLEYVTWNGQEPKKLAALIISVAVHRYPGDKDTQTSR